MTYDAYAKTHEFVSRMETAIATLDRADKAYDTVENRQMELVKEGFDRILTVLPGSTVIEVHRIQRDYTDAMLFVIRVKWYPPADTLKRGGVTPGDAVQTWLDRLNKLTIAHVFTEGHWKWNDHTTSANGIEQTFIAWYRLFDANVEPDVLDIKTEEAAIHKRLQEIFGNGDLVAEEPNAADPEWMALEPVEDEVKHAIDAELERMKEETQVVENLFGDSNVGWMGDTSVTGEPVEAAGEELDWLDDL